MPTCLPYRRNNRNLNTRNMYFYLYDVSSNRYSQINTNFASNSSYVSFYTNYGGYVIITDSPLLRR